MVGIKTDLRASSLIEVLVASILLMVVFLISLETLGRITTKSDHSLELIDAQNKTDEAIWACELGAASKTERYAWGTITLSKQRYKEFDDLVLLRIEATLDRNKKKIVRYLILRNEPQQKLKSDDDR